MRLRARLPMGNFIHTGSTSRKYLFLSGGSGITPLMAMARYDDDLALGHDSIFVHSARSPADIIFRTELRLMAEHDPGFRFVPICETDSPGEPWSGLRGRLSLEALRLIAPDLLARDVYTCGPAPYMAAVRAMLAEAGFDMRHYHEESFDFVTVTQNGASPDPPVPAAASGFSVNFTVSGRTIHCGPDTVILSAAFAAGLRLPSSCTKGVCGTCKSNLLSGKVDMQHGGGIRKREIDAGQILICCSKPLSDLVIER
jgi:ferredoxin-NADP reductase